MSSIKCKNCGLSNFSSEVECQRCGTLFRPVNRDKRPSRFSLTPLLMAALLGTFAYYLYDGAQDSIEKVNAVDAKRVAAQPAAQPRLSRSEYERQQSGHFGDAVRNSSSLNAHQQQIKQTEKTMQQISNGQTSK